MLRKSKLACYGISLLAGVAMGAGLLPGVGSAPAHAAECPPIIGCIDTSGVELPEVNVPEIELPDIELPDVELPEVELPEVEVPEIIVPEVDVEVPEIVVPEVDVELPEVELPEVELPEVELPQVELPEVNPAGISLPEVPQLELPSLGGPGLPTLPDILGDIPVPPILEGPLDGISGTLGTDGQDHTNEVDGLQSLGQNRHVRVLVTSKHNPNSRSRCVRDNHAYLSAEYNRGRGYGRYILKVFADPSFPGSDSEAYQQFRTRGHAWQSVWLRGGGRPAGGGYARVFKGLSRAKAKLVIVALDARSQKLIWWDRFTADMDCGRDYVISVSDLR